MQTLFESMDDPAIPLPPGADAARRMAVLVPYPVDRAYTYAVPPGMDLQPGDYVRVPLAKREVIGVVWGDSIDDVPVKKLKTIISRSSLPPMPKIQRDFIDWVAEYTMTPAGLVLKMAVSVPDALEEPKASARAYRLTEWAAGVMNHAELAPPPSKRGEVGRGVAENAKSLRKDMTEPEKRLWHKIKSDQLGVSFRKQHPIPPYIADFVCIEKNLIIEVDGESHAEQTEYDRKRTAFLESQGFKVLRFWNNEVMENIDGVLVRVLEAIEASRLPPTPTLPPHGRGREQTMLQNLSPAKRRVLERLANSPPRRAVDLGVSTSVIKGLIEKGLVESVDVFAHAPCAQPDITRAGAVLSGHQALAAEHLCKQVGDGAFHATLIDGVTGAGKTEVYFEAVAEALKQNKQVLILLPEIALSNAFLDRFKARFGCAPALWHSSLGPAQRRNTWRGVANGETRVVVGARSALFLPYDDLGLIVVDEEHDPAYKQEDGGTIYHARDMAVVRAHLAKIPIILVSATPSLETIVNAWAGRYDHLHLPDRHGGATMPEMHLLDLRIDKPERQRFIAPTLKAAMAETLARGEQVLLFLNRRGYAPLTLCRTCGQRMECPRCTAWLVEHKAGKNLQCHHCGYAMPFPKNCPTCGDEDSLAACGPGVERIYEEVLADFPEARTLVLASDTADSHDKLKAVLDDIRERRIDIMIGTQIIAKGHHFPGLTLVGVIDADLGLGGGDLRAAERTYQLLHQVAGRAGREQMQGQVYLQTFIPENRVMQALAGVGRDAFLDVEAQEREKAHMPPYSRLVGVIVSGRDEKQVENIARALGLAAPQAEGVRTLGPAPAPFYRLRGDYRRRLLIQSDKAINIQKTIQVWLDSVKTPSTVRVQVDIDPQSFL